MAIPSDLNSKWHDAIIESTATPGQAGLVVLDSTGADISGGGGTSDVNIDQIGGNAVAVGAGNSSNGTQRVLEAGAGTGTASNIASSATNVTLLASNASRRGATIYNESTQVLYLKLGATASATSYTVQVGASAYYEVPFNYTGIIDGIWASANGNARITELT